MEGPAYKLRIAMLWIIDMVAFFAYRTIALNESATEVTVLSNSELATVLLIMMAFAFLSMVVKSGFNRLMNLIAGAIFALLQAIMLGDGLTAYPTAVFNLMTGAAVFSMGAVVWLAARWPKVPVDASAPDASPHPQ